MKRFISHKKAQKTQGGKQLKAQSFKLQQKSSVSRPGEIRCAVVNELHKVNKGGKAGGR